MDRLKIDITSKNQHMYLGQGLFNKVSDSFLKIFQSSRPEKTLLKIINPISLALVSF